MMMMMKIIIIAVASVLVVEVVVVGSVRGDKRTQTKEKQMKTKPPAYCQSTTYQSLQVGVELLF